VVALVAKHRHLRLQAAGSTATASAAVRREDRDGVDCSPSRAVANALHSQTMTLSPGEYTDI
jgi:hypothetical protein